jgi:aspartate aminotransferase-like enzyme
MAAMGLSLYAKENPSVVVTAVEAPSGVDGQKVVSRLREKYGIWIAGGQAQAKGKIFRIAHMGYIETMDLLNTIAGLEMVLNELGYQVDLGVGVRAAEANLGKEAGA